MFEHRVHTKNCNPFKGLISRILQGPHSIFKDPYQECNIISPIVQKCIFSTLPVHSHRVLRLELFPPLTSLYFSVRLSLLHKTKNSLYKLALTSLSYHFIFCLTQPKSIKNTPQVTTFNVEENSRTFQGLLFKIQVLFKTV